MLKDTQDIADMMRMYDQTVRETPTTDIPSEEIALRAQLIFEEFREFCDAAGLVVNIPKKGEFEVGINPFSEPDMVEIADALGDMVVVVKGGYHAFGIDGDAILENEIMPSNLAKAIEDENGVKKVRKNEFGKTIKPEGWESPNIRRELERQGWSDE